MSDRGYQERARQQNPAGYENPKQNLVYYHQPQTTKQQQPQTTKPQQPPAPKQLQPQATKQPQPQAVKQLQPQAAKQPQATKQPQPQPTNQQNASVSHVSANAQNNNDTRNEGTRVYTSRDQAPRSNKAGGGQPQEQRVVTSSSVYNDPNSDARDRDPPFATYSLSDKRIRQAFIQKVYLILTAMLLVTVVFICIFLFVEPVKKWVHTHWWLWLVAFVVYLTVYLVLVCCDTVRRSFPTNYICLIIFNLAFSWVCAMVSSYYSTEIVLAAIGITALVCVSISIFAIQTKIDFTLCAGLLFVLVMVVFIFGIAVSIVFLVAGRNYILTCVYGAVAALVMGLFLAYDTQLIVGGRKYQLSPEEYIYGALQLYMDVGTLYMIILSFFSCTK